MALNMRLFSSLFRQSLSSGGIFLLVLALSLAISATSALKFSSQQIRYSIDQQAAGLLAADLVISQNQPLDPIWQQRARAANLQISQSLLFSSMAHTGENFVMVNVKAIDDAFPLRGQLRISSGQQRLQAAEIWVSQRVLDLLKLSIGDRLSIADAEFKIAGRIDLDSNQEMGIGGFSPTVLIRQQDVARTHAIQVGSRIEYRLLLAGRAEQVQQFVQHYRTQIKEPMRLRLANDSNSGLLRPIDDLATYMQLANLLTLLLCGIAIALTCQRYVSQQQDHIAMLRCLGASRWQITGAFLALLGVVGLLSSGIGSVLGICFGYGLLQLMLLSMPYIQLEFSLRSVLIGPLPNAVLTCFLVLLGFVLPSVLHLVQVPPLRVLRQARISPVKLVVVLAAALLSMALFAWYLSDQLLLSLSVMAGIILLCGGVWTIAWLGLSGLRRLWPKLEQWIRQPQKIALQVTALALGLSLISLLFILRSDLLLGWQKQLPADTPNQFIYGLPPSDKAAFEQAMAQRQWPATALYPNVRGRLVAKNGQQFAAEQRKQHESLRRELNLTQAEHYPQDNLLVAGQAQFNHVNQVSVEDELAQELGIKLGDRLDFDLAGSVIRAEVVSLRQVQWESFKPNFYFVFSPHSLDENAGSYLGSFYLPASEQQHMATLIQQFPTTVFIDVNAILDQVKGLIGIITQLLSFLALLVLLAGLLVLLACLNLMLDERRHEVALLRAIGMSERRLKNHLSQEMAFIGGAAGLLSIGFAEVVSWIIAYRLNLDWQLHWQYWGILPLMMAGLCAVIGRYRLKKLWQVAPLLSLRQLN
jgi:putative ABC transport system permease protein